MIGRSKMKFNSVNKLITRAITLLEAKVPSLKENTRIIVFNPKHKKYFLGTIDKVLEDRYVIVYDNNNEKVQYMFQSEHLIGKGVDKQYKQPIEEEQVGNFVTSYYVKPTIIMLQKKEVKEEHSYIKALSSLKENDRVIVFCPKRKTITMEDRESRYFTCFIKSVEISKSVVAPSIEFKIKFDNGGGTFLMVPTNIDYSKLSLNSKFLDIGELQYIIGKANTTKEEHGIPEYELYKYMTELFVKPSIFSKKFSSKKEQEEIIKQFNELKQVEQHGISESEKNPDNGKWVFDTNIGKVKNIKEVNSEYMDIIDNPNYDKSSKDPRLRYKKIAILNEEYKKKDLKRIKENARIDSLKKNKKKYYDPVTDKVYDHIPDGLEVEPGADDEFDGKPIRLRYPGWKKTYNRGF